MSILENKSIAIIAMVLLIIASILIGSHNSLTKLSSRAESMFFNGINGDGLCIQSDLDKRLEFSRNLVTVSKGYLSPNDSSIINVETARNQLKKATTINDKYKANKNLDEAMFNLYTTLENQGITENEELLNNFSKNPTRIYSEFSSYGDTIKHDKYNEYANDFNGALKNFPANILSKVTFVKSLELFQ